MSADKIKLIRWLECNLERAMCQYGFWPGHFQGGTETHTPLCHRGRLDSAVSFGGLTDLQSKLVSNCVQMSLSNFLILWNDFHCDSLDASPVRDGEPNAQRWNRNSSQSERRVDNVYCRTSDHCDNTAIKCGYQVGLSEIKTLMQLKMHPGRSKFKVSFCSRQ